MVSKPDCDGEEFPQLWDEHQVQRLVDGARVEGDGCVLLGASSPANTLEAARRILGQDAEFSHLALGMYPVYVAGND